MSSKTDYSNSDNQLCSFSPSLHDSLNDDNKINLSSVMHWINSFEFTRPKKNIGRDFSDASNIKTLDDDNMLNFY